MSKYERFIIYPLLFVSLFYGLIGGQPFVFAVQDDVFDQIKAREILVVDDEGDEKISMISEEGTGWITVNTREQGVKTSIRGSGIMMGSASEIMSLTPRKIDIFDREMIYGVVTIEKNEHGNGSITLHNNMGNTNVVIGSTFENNGAIWFFNKDGRNPIFYGNLDE